MAKKPAKQPAESIGAQMVRRRYENQTPEERSAAAKHAAEVRWSRSKQTPKKKGEKSTAARTKK